MGCVAPGEEEEEDLSKGSSVSLNKYLNNSKGIAIKH
jgi:hypothetical protein